MLWIPVKLYVAGWLSTFIDSKDRSSAAEVSVFYSIEPVDLKSSVNLHNSSQTLDREKISCFCSQKNSLTATFSLWPFEARWIWNDFLSSLHRPLDQSALGSGSGWCPVGPFLNVYTHIKQLCTVCHYLFTSGLWSRKRVRSQKGWIHAYYHITSGSVSHNERPKGQELR